MKEEDEIKDMNIERGVKQEICNCGNRSFFILCWHETEYKGKIQTDKHNWIVVCSKCGSHLENDDLFWDSHEHD